MTTILTESALEIAIAAMFDAAAALADAKNHEAALEDERALVKRDATKRLLDSGVATSATAAEKLVELDEQYAAHRVRQRGAVIDSQLRWAVWEASRCRAWALARGNDL